MVKFRLKILRYEYGNVTQEEVERCTGIRRPTLSAIENNKAVTISLTAIDKLCKYFDCQPCDLFTYIKDK